MRLRSPTGKLKLRNAIVVAVATTFVVSACSGELFSWGGRRESTGQWPTENSTCRAYAKQKSEQEYALVQSSGPSIDYTRTTGYDRQIDRYDAGRRQQALFNSCMKQRGYRPVEAEKSEEDKESP